MSLEYRPEMRIFPPRPEWAIAPATLPRFGGYVAQYKFNDVRTIVCFFPSGEIELLNRYLLPHRFYQMSEGMLHSLKGLKLRPDRFHILDGGLMHRVSEIRDRLILWDVLVHEDRYLVGDSMIQRYQLLEEICGHPKKLEQETGAEIALRVNSHVWMAQNFTRNLQARYRHALKFDFLEGLLLKKPAARLERALGERNNWDWQIRVRKPHVNYAF